MKTNRIRINIQETIARTGNYEKATGKEKEAFETRIKCKEFLNAKAMNHSKDINEISTMSPSDIDGIETAIAYIDYLKDDIKEDTHPEKSSTVYGISGQNCTLNNKGVCSDSMSLSMPNTSNIDTMKIKHVTTPRNDIHPYVWNKSHEMWTSRTIKTDKDYWKSETAKIIHQEAVNYFAAIAKILSQDELKDIRNAHIEKSDDGFSILEKIALNGSFKWITYNLLKSIASFVVQNKDGQWVNTDAGIISMGIMLDMFKNPHDYEEVIQQVTLIYSELLLRHDWYNFIIPNGKGWIEYKTYITPRSKKEVSYYNKIRQLLEKWIVHEWSGKIVDIEGLCKRFNRSFDDMIDLLHTADVSSFDGVMGNAMIHDFLRWLKPQVKEAVYDDVRSIANLRLLSGLKDKEIATALDLPVDRVKYIGRLMRKAYDRYQVKDVENITELTFDQYRSYFR